VSPSVKVSFLGGLSDIGRNCATVESDDRIVILDCGIMFPTPLTPGIDTILPDLRYIERNADRIEAVVFSHGHEDHIGGVVPLRRIVNVPMYGSQFTLGLVRSKLDEAGLLEGSDLRLVEDNERVKVGPFECEFLPITHSIPDGFATVFYTEQGLILHSGDYKLDPTPIDDRVSDLDRIAELSKSPGIRLLMADSTNVEDEGFTPSERTVGAALREIVHARPDRRIIAGCFSSHIHRIQQLCEIAIDADRVVIPVGRSLRRNLEIARGMGVLQIDDQHFAEPEDMYRYDPGSIMVLSTGSQGEFRAGLPLMAAGEHKFVKIGDQDTVVLSSHPIPGNEYNINRLIDGVMRQGGEVVHSGDFHIHVSGHARQGEVKQLMQAAKPEHFLPVHGEFRHLTRQARFAERQGIPAANVHLALDGDQVLIEDDAVSVVQEAIPSGYRHTHGILDDMTMAVLKDRLTLGADGFVSITVVVDTITRTLLGGPQVETRGWVSLPESDHVVDEVIAEVSKDLSRLFRGSSPTDSEIARVMRRAAGRTVGELTRRRPMIVPSVISVS
jgi:ribonuclease J